MVRQMGLGESQLGNQVTDAPLALEEQTQDCQPDWRSQHLKEFGHGGVAHGGQGHLSPGRMQHV
jgi:hypothetical protein